MFLQRSAFSAAAKGILLFCRVLFVLFSLGDRANARLSHSGICNIIEQAKRVCGVQTVTGVIGGFHLFQVNERGKAPIRYFGEAGIRRLYPCHCTSFAVRAAIHEKISVKEVGMGFVLSLSVGQ